VLTDQQVHVIRDSAPGMSHDRFITLWDVARMSQVVQADALQLHPEDAISTKLWVDRLKASNTNVFYKDKLDQSPPGSRLR
jgi:hypothetical protein